jgi:hypothetical protein
MDTFEPLTDEELTFYALKYGEDIFPDWNTYKRAIPLLITSGKFMIMAPSYTPVMQDNMRRVWVGPKGATKKVYGVAGQLQMSEWFDLTIDDPLLKWLVENEYIKGNQ